MISQQQLSDFKNNGFIIIKNFFEKDQINDLRIEAKKIFSFQIEKILKVNLDINDDANFEKLMYRFFELDTDTFINCGKQVQQLISLHKIATEENINKILRELGLEFPIISVRPSMLFN